jgi:hypothetical protein
MGKTEHDFNGVGLVDDQWDVVGGGVSGLGIVCGGSVCGGSSWVPSRPTDCLRRGDYQYGAQYENPGVHNMPPLIRSAASNRAASKHAV